MKTIVPVTLLPLLLMSFVTLAQPQSIAPLYEGESLGEGIEIDGMLYFSGPYYILKIGDENSGWEPIPHAGARAVNLKALNGVLYFTTYDNAAMPRHL